MEARLIEALSALSAEEERILVGEKIDKKLYSAGEDFVISDRRLGASGGISVRTHTRFTPFPPHKHSYTEMMIVLSGSITHEIGGAELKLLPGDVLFLNKHISHSVKSCGKGDIGVNVILADSLLNSLSAELSGTVFSSLLKQNSLSDGEGMYLRFSCGGRRSAENLIENLLLELTGGSRDYMIMGRTVSLLLLYLSHNSGTLLTEGSTELDKDTRREMQISAYVKSEYRTASLSELGKLLYLTPPYLSKLIKELFGKSFKELVIEERISKAEALIAETDMQIGDVIRAVGYENESYFHREFKKRTGKTPLARRKNS